MFLSEISERMLHHGEKIAQVFTKALETDDLLIQEMGIIVSSCLLLSFPAHSQSNILDKIFKLLPESTVDTRSILLGAPNFATDSLSKTPNFAFYLNQLLGIYADEIKRSYRGILLEDKIGCISFIEDEEEAAKQPAQLIKAVTNILECEAVAPVIPQLKSQIEVLLNVAIQVDFAFQLLPGMMSACLDLAK
jgi:hypothetical protein